MKIVLAAVAAAAIASAPASAATNLLTNGSFEAPDLGSGGYTYPAGTVAGWTYNGSALVDATNGSDWYGATPPAGQDGGQFAALQTTSSLSQAFTATKSTATLSFLAGGRPNFGSYAGDQSFTVSLGNSVLGTFSTTSGQAFTSNVLNLSGLTAGNSYTLTFTGLTAGSDQTAFIDAVSVGVPEPTQWALMLSGFGLAGAALRRRRAVRAVAA